jgi:hypothetical protein
MTDIDYAAIVDSCARVISGAVSGGKIFAAGITLSALSAVPELVPLADDFTEAGMPAILCAIGPWTPHYQPGNMRNHIDVHCSVWRPRVPLGDNTNALYADCAAIEREFIAHTKLYLAPEVQSGMLMGGPGIVSRSIPSGQAERTFLTLPFTVQVVLNRIVIPQPA